MLNFLACIGLFQHVMHMSQQHKSQPFYWKKNIWCHRCASTAQEALWNHMHGSCVSLAKCYKPTQLKAWERRQMCIVCRQPCIFQWLSAQMERMFSITNLKLETFANVSIECSSHHQDESEEMWTNAAIYSHAVLRIHVIFHPDDNWSIQSTCWQKVFDLKLVSENLLSNLVSVYTLCVCILTYRIWVLWISDSKMRRSLGHMCTFFHTTFM